jgi:hypothetical protein
MQRAVMERALLSRTAERIWTEGRNNPVSWPVGTRVGVFRTDDRVAWRTPHGGWTAELRRSRGGRHLYLSLFHMGVYVGRYDSVAGWRDATDRSRVHQLRARSLPLPLAG